jgi:hypothetical protein
MNAEAGGEVRAHVRRIAAETRLVPRPLGADGGVKRPQELLQGFGPNWVHSKSGRVCDEQ